MWWMLRVAEGRSARFKKVGLWVKEALWVCLAAGHFQSDAPSNMATLCRGISRSAGFAENALKGCAKWMGEEVRFQGFLKGAKSPSSAPGGVVFYRATIRASSGPASDKSIARLQPPSARSPGVGSTLRPDDSPGKGWLSPAMGETVQSRSRTAGAREELAKKAEKFLGAAMGEGSIDSAIAENAARDQSPFARGARRTVYKLPKARALRFRSHPAETSVLGFNRVHSPQSLPDAC